MTEKFDSKSPLEKIIYASDKSIAYEAMELSITDIKEHINANDKILKDRSKRIRKSINKKIKNLERGKRNFLEYSIRSLYGRKLIACCVLIIIIASVFALNNYYSYANRMTIITYVEESNYTESNIKKAEFQNLEAPDPNALYESLCFINEVPKCGIGMEKVASSPAPCEIIYAGHSCRVNRGNGGCTLCKTEE